MNRKKNRKRSTGWAWTRKYPHGNHPATYRRKNADEVEYITFTHSSEVQLNKNGKLRMVPLSDNISPAERKKNKAQGLRHGENRSYAYPKVYVGRRSALGAETDAFEPVDFDKKRIGKMFEVFPRESVPVTGGGGQYRKRKKEPKKK